ncbi:MAG: low molecular weight protein-tyrosine-phosphatase [Negativibacillus massiliensis]|uniref:low molecular weight protein-tyrosine-phosphatase n=1 Tax=Negativibacillus massiliensis TaxID=1871035 RepID=UPI003999F64C
MIKVLFICHGNICRSPMGEFILKKMVKEKGLADKFEIASAATSTEEIGNPVYPPAKRKLKEHGIDCSGKYAVQLKRSDYDRYDYFLCMDNRNIQNTLRIFGSDPEGKVSLLLSYCGERREVADPWYTDDFDTAYDDIWRGCRAFLEKLEV